MPSSCIASSFYIKPQPEDRNRQFRRCCIASSFYIKPQLPNCRPEQRNSCIASSFYIKPQLRHVPLATEVVVLHPLSTSNHNYTVGGSIRRMVVLHPLSTSNHNERLKGAGSVCVVLHPLSTSNHNINRPRLRYRLLYCILFLHQTTTYFSLKTPGGVLYCILFLHQTTTPLECSALHPCCIASSFYIKPQRQCTGVRRCAVVLHPLSTSNHNVCDARVTYENVVLHPLSTSNHNLFPNLNWSNSSCIASSFYIKPQLSPRALLGRGCCIASSFYIKPQPRTPDTLIFGHLTASRHDTKRGGVHRGSRFDAVFTFSTNIRKIIFTEIRRCMSVQRAGARLRSDSSEANI